MAIYRIRSYSGNGAYLTVEGNVPAATYRNVHLESKSDKDTQLWSIANLTTNVTVQTKASTSIALALGIRNGSDCQLMPANSSSYVSFVAVDSSTGLYRIRLVSDTTKYLTAGGSAAGSDVSWAALNLVSSSIAAAQVWQLAGLENILTMPAGRNCNWNQFYTPIVNALGSDQGCTIVTALDLMNFYGPSSYTINDALPGWTGSINWDTAWKGNFRVGDRYTFTIGSTSSQADAFAKIRAQIDIGRPVIVFVGPTMNNSHTVMCYGYTDGGTDYSHFLVMDPAGNGRTDSSNPDGVQRTLAKAMSFSSRLEGICGIRLTYSKA